MLMIVHIFMASSRKKQKLKWEYSGKTITHTHTHIILNHPVCKKFIKPFKSKVYYTFPYTV